MLNLSNAPLISPHLLVQLIEIRTLEVYHNSGNSTDSFLRGEKLNNIF